MRGGGGSQITGAQLDGPVALDDAISLEAARIKKIDSPANILLAPDLWAGDILGNSLTFLAAVDADGIVLGAQVPIILSSRIGPVLARMASCAVAALVAMADRANACQADGIYNQPSFVA